MRGSRQLRPLWQIAILLPLWLPYVAARWFVEMMERWF
jgi:hypothetical protein